MKNLILFAHPNPASFSAGVKEAVENLLKSQGEEVIVRDLYGMNFEPRLSGQDFESFQKGTIPSDIATEQAFISQAERIILIFPTWWSSMPAILKGYIDRVFSYGFAYAIGQNGVERLLSGKKAVIVTPQGTPAEIYETNGFYKSFEITQGIGIFNYCGIEVSEHFNLAAVTSVDEATRKNYIDQVLTFFRK